MFNKLQKNFTERSSHNLYFERLFNHERCNAYREIIFYVIILFAFKCNLFYAIIQNITRKQNLVPFQFFRVLLWQAHVASTSTFSWSLYK